MLTYFMIAIGIFLLLSFRILDRLSAIQRTLAFHSQWLQELATGDNDSLKYRRMFQPGGDAPAVITPSMLLPYFSILSDAQRQRYSRWQQGKTHELFTAAELVELEKTLSARQSAR